ncbi:chromosome segregation protein SMC, partial [Oscillospiraceae bacterium OttesenSCG-928-G22]|nr:chromosome segregation protein SMC [Oscillospiraceae bacterium OttesenSCG-928-G22]
VTRRYYRSGDSEYYLNRSSVRLRDIHEMFMDTGLGRDGYSIIGQGRIADILSTKSGDRREIFEEAAGISKFRYRKEEAERKLSHTDDNLVRIGDKIAEIELTVEPLREQAETAKQYLLYRDELRVLEVSAWLDGIEKLRENAAKVREDYDIAERQLRDEQAKLDALYRESEALSEKMREADRETERKREELSLAEEREAEIENAITALGSSLENLEENIKAAEAELSEQSSRTLGMDGQIREREKKAEDLKARLSEVESGLSALEEESRAVMASASEITQKIDALGARETAEEAGIEGERRKLSSLEATISELAARDETVSKELSEKGASRLALDAEHERIEAELTEAKEQKESLENVIEGYTLRLENRRKKHETAKDALSKLQREHGSLEDRVRLLSEMERDYEGFSRAVKEIMREADGGNLKGVHGPLSKLIRTEDKFTLAIETALGPALSNIVVSSEEDGRAGIEYLKRRDFGRATFLPLTAIRGRSLHEPLDGETGFLGVASALVAAEGPYRAVVENLLGRTAVCDSTENAIRLAKKHRHSFRIVTLDGQVMNPGGSMTGGSASKSAGILSRAGELSRLKKRGEELKSELERAAAEEAEAMREVTAHTYELDVAKGEMREAEDRALRIQGELSSLEAQCAIARDAENALSTEHGRIAERLAADRISAEELERSIGEREKALVALKAEISEMAKGSEELSGKRGTLFERASELRADRSGILSEMGANEENLAELRRLRAEFETDAGRREGLLSDYKARREAARSDMDAKKREREEAGAVSAAIKEGIASLVSGKMDLEAARVKADREGQEKNKLLLEIERVRSKLETKKTEADLMEKQYVDRLWDNYGLTRLAAEEVRIPLESTAKANRRISELKREIAALGDVNIGAIEEYKRLSERYEYLTGQRDDVERAKADLLKIISEITEKMRDIFLVQFKRINESFSETFLEIFGGGHARLELEDEEDILNCGIDIKVQPPGKQLKTITLLSGGEMAFVAIALYFAILKVRPTPFCVLDEIDAALDDVNVAKFAAYLHKLEEHTQFIIITHRRGTMEESDILYGVTMQAQGISKILALNISEVERELDLKLS